MQGSYLWLLDIMTHAGVALAVTQWPVSHQAPISLCYPNKLLAYQVGWLELSPGLL